MAVDLPIQGQTPWGSTLNVAITQIDGRGIVSAGFDAAGRLILTREDGSTIDAGVPPTAGAPATHTHIQSDVTGLVTALAGKASSTHTHTPASIGAAAATHTHTVSQISDSGTTGRALVQTDTALEARTAIGALGSPNGSMTGGIAYYSSQASLPAIGTPGVLYVTPAS